MIQPFATTTLHQLEQIVRSEEDPTRSKVYFGTSSAAGRELLQALAIRGRGWLNFRATTPSEYAADIWNLETGGRANFVTAVNAAPLIHSILDSIGLQSEHLLYKSTGAIFNAFRDLRLAGISAEEIDQCASEELGELFRKTYGEYENRLRGSGLVDEAKALSFAAGVVNATSHQTGCRVAIVQQNVILSNLEFGFLTAIGEKAEQTFRTGIESSEGKECLFSARHRLDSWTNASFSEERVIQGGPVLNAFCSFGAIGVENEIRAIFQKVLQQNIPLDHIEISYVSREPYVRILSSLADRYGIEVSFMDGIDLADTAWGQSLRQFLLWLTEGRPSRRLVKMMRSGHLRLRADVFDEIEFHLQAADLLAKASLVGGANAYEGYFESQLISLRQAFRYAEGTFLEDEKTEAIALVEQVRDATLDLIKRTRLDATISIRGFIEIVQRYLFEYVLSTDLDPAVEADRVVINQVETFLAKTSALSVGAEDELPARRVIKFLLDILERRASGTSKSQPGTIHVSPVSKAACSGRPHLYVVGLDELSLDDGTEYNSFLTEKVVSTLAIETGKKIPSLHEQTGLKASRLRQVLQEYGGSVSLSWNAYDIADDRQLYPSTVLRTFAEAHGASVAEGPIYSFADVGRSADDSLPLDVSDLVFRLTGESEAETVFHARFPWIGRGALAQESRDSEQWTVFDGQVPQSQKIENPFGGRARWSASRLETLAACPFRYYLKSVLKARVPEEAPEDVWINALEKGSLVHGVLAQFMSELDGSIQPAHQHSLRAAFGAAVDQYSKSNRPPNPAAEYGLREEFDVIAAAFIRDELERGEDVEPFAFEFGFGVYPFHRKSDTDLTDAVSIDLDGIAVSLTGWIDRIDRSKAGGYFITDYKTGSSRTFDARDLLNRGRSLQWALYSYVVESLLGEPVHSSGYFFPSGSELGYRIEDDPAAHRSTVSEQIRVLGRFVQQGMYFQAANPDDACQFCDYARVCGHIGRLKDNVERKISSTPPDSPSFGVLDGWHFAKKHMQTGE